MALPLVAAQPGIWVADQLSPYQNAYMIAHYLDILGDLNVDALCAAIMSGMMEADTLQMHFTEVDGEPKQIPMGPLLLPSPIYKDLRADVNPLHSAHACMYDDLKGNRRLMTGNNLSCNVILRLDERHYVWYQRYHHLQLDAFSFTALTRRIVELYSASVRNLEPRMTPFVPFANVVQEYASYWNSEKRFKDAAYWTGVCKSLPEAVSLSPRSLSGETPTTNILRHATTFDPSTMRTLFSAGEAAGIRSVDLVLAIIALWLLKLSDSKSMGVGFIFMRRAGSEALNATGPVINVPPMCVSLCETILSMAKNINKTIKEMRRHQRYDAEQIVRDTKRSWDSEPLYGPVINFKAFDYKLDFSGVKCTTHHLASGPVRDMEITIFLDDEANCSVEILANAQRYNTDILEKHLNRLHLLVDQFATNIDLSCEKADVLLPEERKLISETNSTEVPISKDTLASLIQKQWLATPESPALQDMRHCLSYRQMMLQANSLAQCLVTRGISPGSIVAVALPRSIFLAVALQAIILVRAAWLPLDTGYPESRLKFMLEDAQPSLLITNTDELSRISFAAPVETFIYDSLLPEVESLSLPSVKPDDRAYIIYTSGSTGQPKGVVLNHQAIVNRLLWMQDQYGLKTHDKVLQKTPCSFDVSVWEFFWPIIVGARLIMAPPEAHRDPEQLQKLILDHQITTIHFVPSMLASFVNVLGQNQDCQSLSRVFCSGEALSTDLAKQWQNKMHVPLYNLYGPTEAAIDVAFYPAFGASLEAVSTHTVPIGVPVWNTSLHILDSHLCPVPLGIIGELYIEGVQLANGYLNRSSLTASSFIKTHVDKILYRTHDLCRRLDSGSIEFIGRSDHQVKIRGQRIELGEIDQVMQHLDGVLQAVTVPQLLGKYKEGDFHDGRQLVSYVVPATDIKLDAEKLLREAARFLPSYMVPSVLVFMTELPLGNTGKLNHRALPLPDINWQQQHRENGRLPNAGLEQVVANAFKTLLGCETVFADDDFFSLGGHSLLAVRLAALLRQELKLPVAIGQIMQSSKVSSLAAQLSDIENQEAWENAGYETLLPFRVSDDDSKGPTLFCIHPASGFAWQFSILQRYLEKNWSIVGVQSAQSDGPLATTASLTDLIESRYEAIRTKQKHGPYHLIGYSLGGTIAHGVAARLRQSGEVVAFLGLLDTWPPESQNWDEKLGKNNVDQAVIDEMMRERQEFCQAQQGLFDNSEKLFNVIENNYASAVRLLATARSSYFDGKATLFVAERTLPANVDIKDVWSPWNRQLEDLTVDCSHVDIISPATFETLGPQIAEVLRAKEEASKLA